MGAVVQGGNSALNDFSIDNMGNSHKVESIDDNNLVIDDKITIHTIYDSWFRWLIIYRRFTAKTEIDNKFNDTHGKVLLIKKEDY